jgi:hypothetical protein
MTSPATSRQAARETSYEAKYPLRRALPAILLCRAVVAQMCPSPPTITPTGAPGTTTWGYVVTSNATQPVTTQVATTNTGAGQLSATNYNGIDWSMSGLPGTAGYSVYRTFVGLGGTPVGVGWIGNTSSGTTTLTDTGQTADATQQPQYYPSLQSYQSGLQAMTASMNAQTAGVPQPRIFLSGQHQFAAVSAITSGFGGGCVPEYGQVPVPANVCPIAQIAFLNAYTDALAQAGALAIDINMDPTPLRSSYTARTG